MLSQWKRKIITVIAGIALGTGTTLAYINIYAPEPRKETQYKFQFSYEVGEPDDSYEKKSQLKGKLDKKIQTLDDHFKKNKE